ncbi:hypothetical protein HWX41_19205 [Bacillus paramycoides]|uniref:hypothetical protein n=1 Tax=Bacillus paramycoides TaxID=2026194 RepID=UPI0015BDC8F3|nr:hypothetical protein [Bacillus paramycoides]NWK71147.1 hypothetical protein [Bacillus paramycoides]
MEFVIDATEMNTHNLSGASIYLDACFVLAYLDRDDYRYDRVSDALDVWSDYENVTLGFSNHTFSEVVNRVFQMLILGSLEVYHHKRNLINQQRDGYNRLREKEKQKLLNLESAKFLYRVASDLDIARFRGGECLTNVGELVKRVKESEAHRHKLNIYYNTAVDIFEKLIYQMQEELGFDVQFLGTDPFSEYQAAKAHMRITQLDAVDSLHLAIARLNDYNFLATLDSDFVHNYYSGAGPLSTIIVKIA